MRKNKLNKWLIGIASSMAILFSTAHDASAKTITVASPGNNSDIKPAIATAVSSAVDGDMIILPEGTFAFTSTVTITKFVSFKGAGLGKTILYRPASISDGSLNRVPMLYFNINRTTPSNITVTDITFKSKDFTTSVATDFGIRFNRCVDFVVSRCRFEGFGDSGIYIDHDDNITGALIFKNEFVHNYKGVDGLGLGYAISIYGSNDLWVTDPKFGTKNFIFIEDNFFQKHRHAIAAGGGALYVCRYNTFKDHLIFHVIDTHNARPGTTGSNEYGTRAVEVYNNTITNTTFKDGTPITAGQSTSKLAEKALLMRAGDAVVYNNTISGFRFGTGLSVDPAPASGTAYPMFCQPGYLSGKAYGASHTGTDALKGNGDLFAWNNNVSLYNSSCAAVYSYYPTLFKQDRDYHDGVAKPGYTAYQYPHPLRSLVGSTPVPPPTSTVAAPTVGTITQPTCSVAKGSVVLTGLPAGSWTINPGAIAGSTTSTTISNLAAGTFNFTVTSAGTTSAPSANVVINAQPATPTALILGAITQPTCTSTGSVVLNGLPSGSWTINPGAITGSTTTKTITGLTAGTKNYTVTNAAGCTSAASANVVINAAPGAPSAPTIGTITQPTCTSTGSVVLNGLPSSGSWTINPGAIAGSGTSKTITGLTAGTKNYTVTNASGCTSVASANVVISAAPGAPTAPTVGTITQPTATVATGSVVLNGLPSSGNWTLNPGAIAGTGSSYTKSGLATGTYNYTVTNASGCTSAASASVVINAQPTPTPVPPTTGNTILVESPGQWNNIQPKIIAAMNSAFDGDVLVLPAGTFCFAENVIVTKCISIKGAGIGITTLYRGEDGVDNLLSTDPKWNSMFNFSGQSCGISVTDITFRSKKPSVVAGDGLSLATDKAIQITNCVDFVISRCRFENFGLAAISVNHLDTKASGLIAKNEFYHNYKGADGLGYGYGVLVTGEGKQWVSSPKLGTNNFIFIEDNTFDEHRTSISGKGGALLVARYNSIKNNILIHAINTLSASSTTALGTRAVEIYNNNITNTKFKDGTPIVAGQLADRLTETAIMMRGGDALVYSNTIVGFRFAVNASIYPVPASSTYPVISQPGYLSGLSLGANHTGTDAVSSDGDLFSYNNTFTPWAGSQTSSVFNNGQTALYKENRDYHLVAKPGYTAFTYPHPLQAGLALKSGDVRAEKIVNDEETASATLANTDIKETVELNLYPNPTTGSFNVQLSNNSESQYKVEVLDVTGRVILSKQLNVSDGAARQLDISDALPGTYFLRVSSDKTVTTKTFQLMKN